MAARRDEPTRVAPYGAPGTRAICDSSIVPLGLRGPFLNALRVDQSDLKQALILGRPRDPCKNTRGAHLMLTRATLARLTAPRTLSLRDPRECGDLALELRVHLGCEGHQRPARGAQPAQHLGGQHGLARGSAHLRAQLLDARRELALVRLGPLQERPPTLHQLRVCLCRTAIHPAVRAVAEREVPD